MKRFLPFLVPIILLLIAIPSLLYIEVNGLAKIVGVIMVILTSVALRFWLYRANKQRGRGAIVKLTANDRYVLDANLSFYRTLSTPDKKRLEERMGLMLAELDFDRFDGKLVGKDECLVFVTLLSLLTWEKEYQTCDGKIVVFKDETEPEMILQHGNPVLFIDETSIYNLLKQISSIHNTQETVVSQQPVLDEFYSFVSRPRK